MKAAVAPMIRLARRACDRMAAELDLIAHRMQRPMAPVFLLTGIARLLGVMTICLGRVIDRAHESRNC